ncbi:hypothetical protein [Rhodococcus sp. MEB064]|uniref:hypothetical protein n=1 Tax=Rhodococcus sp. MEB064 TaxID=1587522 RepID=UPI0005AC1C64|nr:hypothetical protein [Rhodococcus sp. MEB064]KIQ17456.1 hypothetical protein RU01_09680 [Rhodococcus sp. MEB064]
MTDRVNPTPRSCDFLDLVGPTAETPAPDATAPHVTDERRFLVRMVDDRDTVILRTASSLTDAVDVARAYCAAWGAQVRHIEDPRGEMVPRATWETLCSVTSPLPYVYTVELRSPRSTGREELVTALWTSTHLDEALRWRQLLPPDLRSRALVVSNAADGHFPRSAPSPAGTSSR